MIVKFNNLERRGGLSSKKNDFELSANPNLKNFVLSPNILLAPVSNSVLKLAYLWEKLHLKLELANS